MITDIKIFSRQRTDGNVIGLCIDLADSIPYDCEFYYVWSDFKDNQSTIEVFDTIAYKTDVIVWVVADTFLGPHEHSWWRWKSTYGMHIINKICKKHPDKKFILMCELYNTELEVTATNLHVVYVGDQSTRDHKNRVLHQLYNPVKNKKPAKNWIMLNNNPSTHRMSALSYVMGNGLERFGDITMSTHFQERVGGFKEFGDMMYWELNASNAQLKLLSNGFNKIKQWKATNNEVSRTVAAQTMDHVGNFNNFLFNRYKDCFVEIIAETTFNEMPIAVTEKTLNSVYGFNFPIFMSNPWTVSYLRNLGFDMFDDVIDHTYDKIQNPTERLFAVFDNNMELLTQTDSMYKVWDDHKTRFSDNLNFARTKMIDVHRERAFQQLHKIIDKLQEESK